MTIAEQKDNNPGILYHYTSMEALALILQNRTLKFSSLQNVDDLEEAATEDMENFGKFIYASCWTDCEKESIALWKLYTPDMHGVRIALPPFPFIKRTYKSGQYFLSENTTTYINLQKVYQENRGSIVLSQPHLIKVEYTEDEGKLFPRIRSIPKEQVNAFLSAESMSDAAGTKIEYSFPTLGKCKRTDWSFQREWRYILFISPMGYREMYPSSFEKQQEQIRRIEDPNTETPYDSFFMDLDDNAIRNMKILSGPRMNNAEKIYLQALLKEHGLLSNWEESKLHIR